MRNLNTQKITDFLAISLSGLCLVHCLLFPLITIFLPAVSGSFLEGEIFHKFLLIFILPTSILALFLGCKKHRKRNFFFIGGIGLFFLVFAAFLGHELLGEVGEKVLTTLGGLIIAYAHWKNFQSCKKDEHNCCN